MEEAVSDLEFVETRRSPGGHHVLFRQTLAGVPVYDRFVKVSLNREGRPTMALSGYAPHLTRYAGTFDSTPALSPEAVQSTLRTLVADPNARTTRPTLVVYPANPPRLAYHAVVWPTTVSVEWSILIDARTGEPLELFDQTVHHTPSHSSLLDAHATTPSSRTKHSALRTPNSALGQGFVFDPDPLTTSGFAYSPPYVDAEDADVPELNAERQLVDLPDLSQGTDGLYRLEGPYVRIEPGSYYRQSSYDVPAEADPNAFRYTRTDDHFEAVNLYYHIDKSQRYVQDLGFFDTQNAPLSVYPVGEGSADNSQYWPSENVLTFGTGGVDDAEDADVIWHEYGHALLEGTTPGLRRSLEGQSLHEGWADYWAASYRRAFFESGAVPEGDWRRLFPWDGNNPQQAWFGRTLETSSKFETFSGQVYVDGVLWATTLMEIYDSVGKEVSDRLNLQSHAYLVSPVSYRDAAEALLQADLDLYDGVHSGHIINMFDARGYLDAAEYGPVVAHVPVASTEQLGGTVPVEIDITTLAFPIDQVAVIVQVGDGAPVSLSTAPQGEGRYVVQLPLPDEPALIHYYIEATDTEGRRSVLPSNAPTGRFSFQAGPDNEGPTISYVPLTQAALAGWPVVLTARVNDNLGIESVVVAYEVLGGADGPIKREGTFDLVPEGEVYSAPFPVEAELLTEGDVVEYRITARDRAVAANVTTVPALDEPPFRFVIRATGVVTTYDFENSVAGIDATGAWAQAKPAYGLQFAHSGTQAWATVPDGPYADTKGLSTLTLPSVDLDGFGEVYLVFWHWYDTEHNGEAESGGSDALIYDGGNVKVSTDGGVTWALAVPERGYPGQLSTQYDNPLGGEAVFGGSSFGWQREIVPLPTGSDLRIRFDFGTDDGNTSDPDAGQDPTFAGWVIDDVSIAVARPPADTVRPQVVQAPPEVIDVLVQSEGVSNFTPPVIAVRLLDDTGLARVEALYQATLDGNTFEGRVRLAMSDTDPILYRAMLLERQLSLKPGDRVAYTLTATDFDGNTVDITGPEATPLEVQVFFAERRDAFTGLTATGGWQDQGTDWVLDRHPQPGRVSSLLFAPFDLPVNAEQMQFELAQAYRLPTGAGGNLKGSTDGGRTWTVLEPVSGYDGTQPEDASGLVGEPVFAGGTTEGAVRHRFDLQEYDGQQVQLRLDAVLPETLPGEAFWRIEQAALVFRTQSSTAFDVPRDLTLHPNFPDPFTTSTTLRYTLPEATSVRLEVYDVVGRRIDVLVNETQEAGTYSRIFDGQGMASGLYFIRLSTGSTQLFEKMTIVR